MVTSTHRETSPTSLRCREHVAKVDLGNNRMSVEPERQQTENSHERRGWGCLGGCAAILVVLLVGALGWWQYISYVPPIPSPQVTLPAPNGRDDYLAAIQLLPTDSDTQIRDLYGTSNRMEGRFAIPTPRLQKIVQNAQPAMKRLRVGLEYRFGQPPITSFQQPYPELAEYRQLARLLAAESELALREGRTDAALRSGLEAVKMGDQLQHGGSLVHGLVGIAVNMIGLRSVENAVDFADASSSARAAQELRNLDLSAPTVADALGNERAIGRSSFGEIFRQTDARITIQSIPQANGGTPNPSQLGLGLQLFLTPRRKILDNYTRYMDAMIKRTRQPYYAQGPPPTLPLDALSASLVPVYEDARFAWAKQQALRRVILTRLAVQAYTQRKGAPPANLEALVPTYFPELPPDPFASAPLLYRVVNGKGEVYSRGADGDDDGGRDLGNSAKANVDGDLGSTRRPTAR